jgi:phage terminase large subunit-like protein
MAATVLDITSVYRAGRRKKREKSYFIKKFHFFIPEGKLFLLISFNS